MLFLSHSSLSMNQMSQADKYLHVLWSRFQFIYLYEENVPMEIFTRSNVYWKKEPLPPEFPWYAKWCKIKTNNDDIVSVSDCVDKNLSEVESSDTDNKESNCKRKHQKMNKMTCKQLHLSPGGMMSNGTWKSDLWVSTSCIMSVTNITEELCVIFASPKHA
jgi:hypothetical protein